jgi:alpha-tubulin suppressor-like RCC1 family protein
MPKDDINYKFTENGIVYDFYDVFVPAENFRQPTLFTWGANDFGQLGDNTIITRSTPVTTFAGGTTWKSVAGAGYRTFAIKTDGSLWGWGFSDRGLLGTNDGTPNRSTPVTTFAGGNNWKQVSGGSFHTAAIKTDGSLWTWGRNFNTSTLGINLNSDANRLTPITTFAGGTNWKQVATGENCTAAIKTDGTLWMWGSNANGKLGTNDTNTKSTPVTTFAGGTNWKQVACATDHIVAIKTDGSLWTWGRNNEAQLGTNDTNTRTTPVTTFAGGNTWKSVVVSGSSTAAIKTDGSLWLWGSNESGQLGDNTTITRSTPVTTFAGGNNWKQVSAGNSYTAAIKTDGSLWTWGFTFGGRLGNNITGFNSRITPVTTFAGGNNWKSVSAAGGNTVAIQYTPDP